MTFFMKQQVRTIFCHPFQRYSLLGTVMVSLALLAGSATAQNFPHIKTFGFDYIRFADPQVSIEDVRWLSNGNTFDIPGYGGGTAENMEEARADLVATKIKLEEHLRQTNDDNILARGYSNALVLAKFAHGRWAVVGDITIDNVSPPFGEANIQWV